MDTTGIHAALCKPLHQSLTMIENVTAVEQTRKVHSLLFVGAERYLVGKIASIKAESQMMNYIFMVICPLCLCSEVHGSSISLYCGTL